MRGHPGKIARDISPHLKTEVAEVFEPAAKGRGGSSTMPHKRNPVASAIVLTAATRAPGLARLFDPQSSVGAANALVDRVLAAHSRRRAKAPGDGG